MEMTSSDLQLNLDSALMSFGRELLMRLEKMTSDSGSELATLLKEVSGFRKPKKGLQGF